MKKIYLFLLALLLSFTAKSQQKRPYKYDVAGNRTSPTIVIDTKSASATGNPADSVFYEETLADKQVRIYPNPVKTQLTIGCITSIWKLTEENAMGQPTQAKTGDMNRIYTYTAYGMPTGRKAGSIQNFTYDFEVAKGNLKSRKDVTNTRNLTETFGYDNLNRLTNAAGKAIAYSANGNITSIASVGTMEYTHNDKPYQISLITPSGGSVPIREQVVTYTSFQRPATLAENGYNATFTYNAAGDRVKMHLKQGSTVVLTRYYIGRQYEIDTQSNTERLYLGGDAYSAPTVYVKEGSSWKIYYICRDYLGSITHVANANGSLKEEYSYDAWGRLRNPASQVAYSPESKPTLFLGRGYTGHEHLPWFGLVNMNARLYDPALGRFLSPDPYVQMPWFTQNFNRYSYCLNNPLVYVDENGEFWHIVIGAVVGGVANLVSNWKNVDGFWDGFTTFIVGAGAGAATAATGGAGASVWAVAGVSAAGGAITSASNDIVAQTGKNFSGFDKVNWGSVGMSSTIGGVASAFGGATGYWAANSSLLVNNINSPILRSAVVSPLSSGAGHVAGGTTAGLLSGQDLGTAFNNSLNGLGTSMVVGGAIGVASTLGVSYANGISPWTGKPLSTNRTTQPQYDFTPDPNGDNITLYRGTTGSEGNGEPLFMTDNPEYAATYVKNGGSVVEVTIPRSTYLQMIQNEHIHTLQGMHGGMSGFEYRIDSRVVPSILKLFK